MIIKPHSNCAESIVMQIFARSAYKMGTDPEIVVTFCLPVNLKARISYLAMIQQQQNSPYSAIVTDIGGTKTSGARNTVNEMPHLPLSSYKPFDEVL